MSDSVDRLKELLFDRETETLSDLSRRIELVAETERLSHSELKARLDELKASAVLHDQLAPGVAAVLDRVIQEAEEIRHDEVSNAIAPLVVRTIKTELKNSQDEMVEVLFPITGRMVKAYVATAIAEMMTRINRRLETNSFMLRVRSLLSGRSMAELALVDAERLRCDELYLIRRGVGALVARWPDRLQHSNLDAHMSGVLAAINEFAHHSFKDEGGNVRAFALDNFTIYMRASPLYLLAAKCHGTPVPGLEDTIDREFLAVAEAIAVAQRPAAAGAAVPDEVPRRHLSALADRIEARVGEAHDELSRAGMPFSPLKALITLVMLPLLAGLGWLGYTHWEAARVYRIAEAAMLESRELNGYPLRLEVGHRGRWLSLEGLAPSEAAKTELFARLGRDAPEVAIRDRIALLPSAPADPEPRIAQLRTQLAGLEFDMTRAAVRRAVDRAQRRLENALPDLQQIGGSPTVRQRQQAGEAARTIEQVMRDLSSYRASALGEAGDTGAVGTLREPLRMVAMRLADTAAELAALLAAEPVRSPARSQPRVSPGVVEAAEELALAAERVATVAAAVAQTSTIRIPEASAREQLASYLRSNAIFFANNDDYRVPAQAESVLARIADLMGRTDVLLRVVGYTDERGGLTRNGPLAAQRADKVLTDLVQRGIPRDRLVPVGRPNGPDLSPTIGPDSPNRRVEFEIGFPGESAGVPP